MPKNTPPRMRISGSRAADAVSMIVNPEKRPGARDERLRTLVKKNPWR
jgi:hypothetical protein